MRRAIDFLAPLGLVIIVGSIAWQRIGRTLPGKPDAYLIAGAALILAHILLRGDEIAKRVESLDTKPKAPPVERKKTPAVPDAGLIVEWPNIADRMIEEMR